MSVYGPTRDDLPPHISSTGPARQLRKRPRRLSRLLSKLKQRIEKLDEAHKTTEQKERQKTQEQTAAQTTAPTQAESSTVSPEQQQPTAGQAHVAELEKHGSEVRAYPMEVDKPMPTAGICLGDTTRQPPTGLEESGKKTGPPQADTKEAAEKRQQRRKKEQPGIATPQEGVIPGLYAPQAPPSPPHTPPHIRERYENKLKDLEDKIQEVFTRLEPSKKTRFDKEEIVRPAYGDVEYTDWDEHGEYAERAGVSADEPYVEEIEEADWEHEEYVSDWPVTSWKEIIRDDVDNPNVCLYVKDIR